MPNTIPPFVQYQGGVFSVPGLWNKPPPEGDRTVRLEFDWVAGGGPNACIQVPLAGGATTPLSQIAALYVDNSRCSVDVEYIFPDTGFVLHLPAYNTGLYPVLTNALTFYASAPGAAGSDVTTCMVCNSLPPPVAVQPTAEQTYSGMAGVSLAADASTQVIGATVNGEMTALQVSCASAVGGTALLSLVDGNSNTVWSAALAMPASAATQLFSLSGIRARFLDGLSLVVGSTTFAAGSASVNLYYTSP